MATTSQIISVIVILAVCSALSTRSILVSVMIISGYVCIFIPVTGAFPGLTVIITAGALILFLTTLSLTLRRQIFKSLRTLEIKWWRIIARPFAVLFIPIRTFAGQRFLIYLLGGLCLLFIGMDLYRIISRREISLLFKKNEFLRFSSMTSFLVTMFILFLLFPPEIACLCLVFVIFGDVAAKLLGIRFGRIKIFHGKTLEGSLAFLTGSIFSGSLVCSLFHLDFPYLITGALFATIAELLSFHLDDNFTVGILTGGFLYALQYFQVI